MNDHHLLEKLITQRRTIHRFKPDPVSDQIIDGALARAIYAPNHNATHPYHFYKIGKKTKAALLLYAQTEFSAKNPDNAQTKIERWRTIPHWIVATQAISDDQRVKKEDYATLSIALYIAMLSLHEEGVGSKWSTASLFFTDQWYELCKIDASKEEIIGTLWCGYADITPKIQVKPSFAEFVHTRD